MLQISKEEESDQKLILLNKINNFVNFFLKFNFRFKTKQKTSFLSRKLVKCLLFFEILIF